MRSSVFIVCGLLAVVKGRTIDEIIPDKPRIVNGADAKVGERPYQVSLQDRIMGHFCGGSILNEYWIVTAAHCVRRTNPNDINVTVGTISLKEPYSSHRVVKKIWHKKYGAGFINDIALLKVATPFEFSSRVQPVTLPEAHATIKINSSAIVSGWGNLEYNGEAPDILQKATVYILDQEVCKAYVHPNAFFPSQVCTNDPTSPRGACNGDSGGPLTHNDVLVGIVSWSIKTEGCGSPRYPNVYTRVSEHIDWIQEQIKSNND